MIKWLKEVVLTFLINGAREYFYYLLYFLFNMKKKCIFRNYFQKNINSLPIIAIVSFDSNSPMKLKSLNYHKQTSIRLFMDDLYF